MKCLLVDDEPGIREGLAALLRRKGHDVQTAADCAAARAALATQSFDIVITDWRLPDGFASTFLGHSTCPVVAVSGHPEEVELVAPLCQVMGKPVRPAQLIEVIERHGAICAQPAATELPIDVREVIEDLLGQLPADSAVQTVDDGTFVQVTVELPRNLPRPMPRGGDARWVSTAGGSRLELRLCRDGRCDPAVPTVTAGQCWPTAAELAVDFHDTDLTAAQLLGCLEAAGQARAAGRIVHFLNVPARVRSLVAGLGRAHDMPMKATVGPRLSAELADLWSQP